MEWAQVLVIILSIFLALFLLVGIVLFVMLIRVTKQIKSVTSSAERTARQIENVAFRAGSIINPLFVIRSIRNFVNKRRGKTHE